MHVRIFAPRWLLGELLFSTMARGGSISITLKRQFTTSEIWQRVPFCRHVALRSEMRHFGIDITKFRSKVDPPKCPNSEYGPVY